MRKYVWMTRSSWGLLKRAPSVRGSSISATGVQARGNSGSLKGTKHTKAARNVRARGEFVVSLQPVEPFAKGSAGVRLDRLSITKTFKGDLVGESLSEMLSVRSNAADSAGYVAGEQKDPQYRTIDVDFG
jgi:hypothetical protein